MAHVGLALFALVGIYLYLDGTGAAQAAVTLTAAGAVYVLLTALMMRE